MCDMRGKGGKYSLYAFAFQRLHRLGLVACNASHLSLQHIFRFRVLVAYRHCISDGCEIPRFLKKYVRKLGALRQILIS